MNDNRWTERRLESLDPPAEWRPDAVRGMARLRERDRAFRVARRWLWAAVTAASVVLAGLMAVPAPCQAASTGSCGQPLATKLWNSVFPKPAEAPAPGAPPETPKVIEPPVRPDTPKAAEPKPRPAPEANYKQAGSPQARITCEVYTDYECPACAVLYRDVVPQLRNEYVRPGKVRLVHRDFPLPRHAWSRLAARWANAAGTLGYYEAAEARIFATQAAWSADGSLDVQLAPVLAPGILEKARDLAEHDSRIEQSIEQDMAIATSDGINRTPTIVVVSKGSRQIIAPVPPFSLLKAYLDRLLESDVSY